MKKKNFNCNALLPHLKSKCDILKYEGDSAEEVFKFIQKLNKTRNNSVFEINGNFPSTFDTFTYHAILNFDALTEDEIEYCVKNKRFITMEKRL